MKKIVTPIFFLLLSLTVCGQVKYDEGRVEVLGVQLLQHYENANHYYYLPQFPRLSEKENGDMELMCIKYVGEGDQPSGGLFHALISFSLSEDMLLELQAALEEKIPGGKIMGAVQLEPLISEEGEGTAGFQIVSSIMSNAGGENSFSRSIISSGHAPLLPGSKAAIAANLTPEGATLLWNSFTGASSDVSASINACYEAWVKAYNATVTAEMSVVYDHFSQIANAQDGFSRRQLRNISDELQRSGNIKVEVFDRSKGVNVKASEMEGILNLVTDKLIETMFNTETGWSKAPDKEQAVTSGQIKGRQKRGFITKLFKGTGDSKYISDDQFVLKKRSDIQTNTFYLNLVKSSTIKVPVHSSGNLGGFYEELGNDERYFRTVDLNDPSFQQREIFFQIDGGFADAFASKINFVSVNFRKKYDNGNDLTKEIFFNHADIQKGEQIKSVTFPRLGIKTADWIDYEYQLNWAVRNVEKPLSIPGEDKWLTSNAPVISLTPPFSKKIVEIDADKTLFKEAGISTAIVEFASTLAGNVEKAGRVLLRTDDPESSAKLSLFHDKGERVVYRVTWVSKNGTNKGELTELDTDYLFLLPPKTSLQLD